MRIGRVSSALCSGLVVYYAMAACGGGSSSSDGAASSGAGASGGASSGASSGGASSGASSGDGSSGVVPNAMADTWYASGSRLKVRYLDGDDGSKQFFGWHDSVLNDDCYLGQHADGSYRCLPTIPDVAFGGSYFAAGCTQAAAIAYKGTTPKYVQAADTAATYRLRFYKVGATLTTLYVGTPGSCTSTSVPPGYDAYLVGAEVPSSSFAGATVKIAP